MTAPEVTIAGVAHYDGFVCESRYLPAYRRCRSTMGVTSMKPYRSYELLFLKYWASHAATLWRDETSA